MCVAALGGSPRHVVVEVLTVLTVQTFRVVITHTLAVNLQSPIEGVLGLILQDMSILEGKKTQIRLFGKCAPFLLYHP